MFTQLVRQGISRYFLELFPEHPIKVTQITGIYGNKFDPILIVLPHLPLHNPNILLPHPSVIGINQTPVLHIHVIFWEIEIGVTNLLTTEPSFGPYRSLVFIAYSPGAEIVGNMFLRFASDLLAVQSLTCDTILNLTSFRAAEKQSQKKY